MHWGDASPFCIANLAWTGYRCAARSGFLLPLPLVCSLIVVTNSFHVLHRFAPLFAPPHFFSPVNREKSVVSNRANRMDFVRWPTIKFVFVYFSMFQVALDIRDYQRNCIQACNSTMSCERWSERWQKKERKTRKSRINLMLSFSH